MGACQLGPGYLGRAPRARRPPCDQRAPGAIIISRPPRASAPALVAVMVARLSLYAVTADRATAAYCRLFVPRGYESHESNSYQSTLVYEKNVDGLNQLILYQTLHVSDDLLSETCISVFP